MSDRDEHEPSNGEGEPGEDGFDTDPELRDPGFETEPEIRGNRPELESNRIERQADEEGGFPTERGP